MLVDLTVSLFDRLFTVCDCAVIGRFAGGCHRIGAVRGREHPNGSSVRTSLYLGIADRKTAMVYSPQLGAHKISIPAHLTGSGVFPKTSGVIAQNVVFVEQETP
jgi:hypothetical protein